MITKLSCALLAAALIFAPAAHADDTYSPGSRLEIQKSPASVTLSVPNSTVPCEVGTKCTLKVMFNRSGPFVFKATPADGHTLTVDNSALFLKRLQKAQFLTIEVGYKERQVVNVEYDVTDIDRAK